MDEIGEVVELFADDGRLERVAAIDIGKSTAMVCTRVPSEKSPDRRVQKTFPTMGIDGVPVYQLQSGCSGAVQALTLAGQVLAFGAHGTALVIGGDTTAKFFDIDAQAASLSSGEQVSGVMFGDGAGAVVLSAKAAGSAPLLRHAHHRLVGLGKAPGHAMDWYGSAPRDPDRPAVFEDYKAIEQAVPGLACEVLAEVLQTLDWKADELDFLLPPQLSAVMTGKIVRTLAVAGAQEVSCVADTGNTANALPFFQLERLLPKLGAGQRAVAVTIESSKWIKGGFAVERR